MCRNYVRLRAEGSRMRSWVSVTYVNGESNSAIYPSIEQGALVVAELARVAHMVNIASLRFEVEPVPKRDAADVALAKALG
jgi:hypothetical protein